MRTGTDRKGRHDSHQPRDEYVESAQTNAPLPRAGRRLVAAAVGAALVLAGGVVAGLIANNDADRDAASTQGGSGFAADEPTFSTLGELVRHADLVVVGTVAQVEPGKILEAENPDEPARELNTDIRVEDVLKGSTSSPLVTVATLEPAYGGAENDPRRDWREPGVRVVAFISQSPEGGSLAHCTSRRMFRSLGQATLSRSSSPTARS